MKEINIEQLELISGGFEFGRDYIDLAGATGGFATTAGAVRAATTQGTSEAILARSGLTAARAGAVAIPILAYNGTVWVNNNTPLQDWLATGIDKVTGLDRVGSTDKSGNNYDGTDY